MTQNFCQDYPATVVLRHRRENLKKCSLRGLEARSDFKFFSYPSTTFSVPENAVVLSLSAPELTRDDGGMSLLILDGTWRYAEKMYHFLHSKQSFQKRSLPKGWKTAYPRRQLDCSDPERGLASIEAIFAAYAILGRKTEDLLEGYYWKDQFLEMNAKIFNQYKI